MTKKAPFYHTFFSGILAGSIGAYLVTPLDVIKTRIQTTTKAEGEKTYKGKFNYYLKYFVVKLFLKL